MTRPTQKRHRDKEAMIPKTSQPTRPAIVRICEECGEPFWARLDRLRQGKARYCSISCGAKQPRYRPDVSGDKNPRWRGGISQDHYRYRMMQMIRYPERDRARKMVYRAIKAGELVRGSCADCGATEKTHAHHEDYARPLDVIWLCRSCHRARHGGKH